MTNTKHNKLPNWLKDLLPEPVQPHVIKAKKQGSEVEIQLESPDGSYTTYSDFGDLSKAKAKNGVDVLFDESMKTEFKDNFIGDMLLFPLSNGNSGAILAYSDENRQASLENAYQLFLKAEREYRNDPRNFVKAWNFIDTHPAFWTCSNLKANPWQWQTEGYCSKLIQYVSNENGKPVISLSGGGHVPVATHGTQEPYTEHYGDWRLEVYSETFETAIIELAFRVSKSFTNEGESLSEEHFPQEPPAWVTELRDRMEK